MKILCVNGQKVDKVDKIVIIPDPGKKLVDPGNREFLKMREIRFPGSGIPDYSYKKIFPGNFLGKKLGTPGIPGLREESLVANAQLLMKFIFLEKKLVDLGKQEFLKMKNSIPGKRDSR